MAEPSVQRVVLLWRRLDVTSDEDGYHEGVDRQDTGHDNGDEGLRRVS